MPIGFQRAQFSRIALAILLLLESFAVIGQGTVKGVVTGNDDDALLLAATILVKGTSTGTVTDYNGEYILVLKAGTHILQISYIGYKSFEEEVTLTNNQTLELNVVLSPESIMGEEVVITAQARGQLAAVNQQLRSNQIVNVVSSERIKELPDANAAQAISRLPGIHLDGSKIVIRGVQPKMNKILINGVEMPSTEANSRASSLGMISSNMLSGIEVYKTLTPDMDADAIGGVVNLKYREAPDDLQFNLMTQGTYNQQENIFGGYKIWGDISNRFFKNKLGLSLNLNYEQYTGGSDEVDMRYTSLEEAEIGSAPYMCTGFTTKDKTNTSDNWGGSLIVDYRLKNGNLIFTSMMNLSESENISRSDMLDADSKRREINLSHSMSSMLLLNNSLQYKQQIGLLKLNAGISYISMDRKTDYNYNFRFRAGMGAFYMDSLTNQKLLEMEPYEMYDFEIPDSWETIKMDGFEINLPEYNEHRALANLDLELPLSLSENIMIRFKTGAKYRKMNRTYDASLFGYGGGTTPEDHQAVMQDWLVSIGHELWQAAIPFTIFRDYDYQPNGKFLNGHEYYYMPYVLNLEYTDQMALEEMDYNTLMPRQSNWSGDYWGGEDMYAGYLMAEMNLGSRWLIIPGVRYESVKNNYSALKVETISGSAFQVRDTLNKPVMNSHWFPHFHMRFQATDWWNIRFSYNKTLSRPDYNHAIPKVNYNVARSSGSAGNPYIRPAVSSNLDLNFTFYSWKMGLITIGGFMKRIDEVFYSQSTIVKNIPDTTIISEFPVDKYPALAEGTTSFFLNNPNSAFVKGLEIEWQSNLTYLPRPFNGLVLNANYTHVWSETDYMQHRILKNFIPVFPYIEEVESDTVYTNRLLHQANDIANVSLGYDYKNFSARVSFRFQGNVISGISGRPEGNSYTTDIYKIDFVAKQKIPVGRTNFEVFLNVLNLTNSPSGKYSIYPNKGVTITSLNYSGRRFQLGIRLSI